MGIHITNENERDARSRLAGDWDSAVTGGTVSVHLPEPVAVEILDQLGWRRDQGGWSSPNLHHYWGTDEALQVALVAFAEASA